MATQLQIRRGTSTQVAAFTGAEGEIVVNTTNDSVHVNDGSTAGGFEMARADLNNVSDTDLNAALTGNTVSALTITTLTLGATAITATGTELNLLDGVTATTAELNYVDGVTSAIQTQIDTKAPLASPTFTGTVTADGLTVDTTTLVVDATNNRVGIGTSSPNALLHLSSAGSTVLNVEATGANDSRLRITSGNSNISYIEFADPDDVDTGEIRYEHATNNMQFRTAGNVERLRITSAGSVGIGTTSPGRKFTVQGGSGDTLPVRIIGGSGTTTSGLEFQDPSTTADYKVQVGSVGDNLYLRAGGAERMRITSAGQILQGINTIPTGVQSSRQLISSSATGAEIIAYREDNGVAVSDFCGAFLIGNDDNSGTEDHFAGMWGQVSTVSGNMDLKFAAGRENYELGSPHMTLDYNGNLLVGKTTAAIATAGTFIGGGGNVGLVELTRDGSYPLRINRTTSDGQLVRFDKDGTTVGSVACRSSGGNLQIHTNQSGIDFGGDGYLPMRGSTITDVSLDIGSSSYRYKDAYIRDGVTTGSDRNQKQDIETLSDAEQRVALACKGLLRKWRWIDAVEAKGDEARIHFGIIAQDLQDAFTAEGLDAGRYAMFISSTWTDEDGNEQTRLGVRYSELLAFIISAI